MSEPQPQSEPRPEQPAQPERDPQDVADEEERKRTLELTKAELAALLPNTEGLARLLAISDEEWDAAEAEGQQSEGG
jgi:hypothetical protein